jgi:putative N6-adenine-specific DNA methylase
MLHKTEAQSTDFSMIAKTLFGLEQVLASELEALGAREVRIMNRAVEFRGNLKLLYKANLWCRTATRILLPIKSFRASDDDQLYRAISAVNWAEYLDSDATLAIDTLISNSGFNNSLYVSQKAKDAIVDQFRRKIGRRPTVNLDHPDLRINLHINENRATLSLDSSGESLHRRGYRIVKGEAPLNEVLAAGILLLSEWDAGSALIDPMCGSGTFVIEAAMIARRMAPGIRRKEFGFMRWKDYKSSLWEKIKKEAGDEIIPIQDFPIIGSDIDEAALKEAHSNAKRVGVEKDIELENKAFENLDPPAVSGTIIMNPPYGARMSVENINSLYKMIGDILKQKYSGYNAFIFSGKPQAAKFVGLRTSKRIQLFNGPLECRLLKYEVYSGSKKMKNQPQ